MSRQGLRPSVISMLPFLGVFEGMDIFTRVQRAIRALLQLRVSCLHDKTQTATPYSTAARASGSCWHCHVNVQHTRQVRPFWQALPLFCLPVGMWRACLHSVFCVPVIRERGWPTVFLSHLRGAGHFIFWVHSLLRLSLPAYLFICDPNFKFRKQMVTSTLALGPKGKFVIWAVDCKVMICLHRLLLLTFSVC